jgi:hypothetical protein
MNHQRSNPGSKSGMAAPGGHLQPLHWLIVRMLTFLLTLPKKES